MHLNAQGYPFTCLYMTYTPIPANTHTPQRVQMRLRLGAWSNFLLFPFLLIKVHQINCGQLCTNPFLSANQGCLTGQEARSPTSLCKLVFKGWRTMQPSVQQWFQAANRRLLPEELLQPLMMMTEGREGFEWRWRQSKSLPALRVPVTLVWIRPWLGRSPLGLTIFRTIWSPNSLDRIARFFKYPCGLTTINNILQTMVKHPSAWGQMWPNMYQYSEYLQSRTSMIHHEKCTKIINTHTHTQRQKSTNTKISLTPWDYFIWKRPVPFSHSFVQDLLYAENLLLCSPIITVVRTYSLSYLPHLVTWSQHFRISS